MGTTSAGWRVAIRLARREAWRRKGQTVLMLVLICLPVLAVTTAAIVWRTQDVSTVEGIDRRIGSADARVDAAPKTEVIQDFDPDQGGYGWTGRDAEPATLDEVLASLGGQRTAVPFVRESLEFETASGVSPVETLATDLSSPLTDGLLMPVTGKYPPGPGEVVVNQAVVDRGPGLGDTITVVRKTPDGEKPVDLEIVGIAESAETRSYQVAAALPGSFGEPPAELARGWLVGGGPVGWDQVRELNELGATVVSRQVLTDPPPPSEVDPDMAHAEESVDQLTITVLALVAVMVLLEVVLLAGPAFAVRAKVQAHTLALVAAAGGTPQQARRIVLATGVVIGVAGGALGVVAGIGLGAIAVPVAQRFDGTRFGPFDVPWALLAVVAGFGFLSAVLAAVVPAFAASKHDVVAVLAGRRGEGRPSARSPILGLVLLGGGITGAALGAGASRGAGDLAAVLIAGSALVSVIGMILVVPLAVSLVARLAARLPLALRFAARDAARHRTRTVPAIAAVGATVAGVVALGIAVSSQEAANADAYEPQLPDGYGSITLSATADTAAIDEAIARTVGTDRVVDIRGIQTSTATGELELEFSQGGEALMLSYWSTLGSPYAVGSEVPDYVRLSAADRREADDVLAAGGLVLLQSPEAQEQGMALPDVGDEELTIDVRQWSPEGGDEPERVADAAAPAVLVEVDGTSPALAVFSPRLVHELGLRASVVGKLLEPPISGDARKDLSEALAALPEQPYFYVERGYQTDDEVRIIQGVLAALGGILMLGGTLTATFLALSDARPDLATMSAIGARPRTRRGVAAAYALVVGGIGALLGAPVGFIPGIAISQPLTRHWDTGATALDVPWLLVGVVVVGLPVVTALAVGACARGRLPLTARID
ncbi:MAG TPA: FtsX-like permease family protein [Nocardioides sp.]|nr:FtsX-like permease family protein [Nocardioides sp.]